MTLPLRIFVVAGEHSGDVLGAKLMAALQSRLGRVAFSGVGGEEMARAGLKSLFPIEDVAVMGPIAIAKALPRIYRRVHETVDAAVAADPDVVVIIDSPEFTHPIARRIRRRAPEIPIIDYVCPSVWAWRPGRARKMRTYVDHVLALLPFEPEALKRLGGPPSTYVGHPLVEGLDGIRNADADGLASSLGLDCARPALVMLPGSRRSEVSRLIGVFGGAIDAIADQGVELDVIIPAVRHVRSLIETETSQWRRRPHIVDSGDKYKAMRLARAALAASGTVTFELALAATPAVVAYRTDAISAVVFRRLIKTPTVVLANLVLGRNVYPELLQDDCTPDKLAAALVPLIVGGEDREAQLASLATAPSIVSFSGESPSFAAADVVLETLARSQAGKSRRVGPM